MLRYVRAAYTFLSVRRTCSRVPRDSFIS